MKATIVAIKNDFELNLMLKINKTEVLLASRRDVETEGISSVCAFADTTNRKIVLIEEDCDQLSNESIRAILFHELAHIIGKGHLTEEECDEFAEHTAGREAVRKAREETELVRQRIRYARAGVPSLDII